MRHRYLVIHELPREAPVRPGGHVALLSSDPLACVGLRRLGLEVRDTLLVVQPAKTMFAFLARMPVEGTVAENVLQHGTGALWIDGCRVRLGSDENTLRKPSLKTRGDFLRRTKASVAGSMDDTALGGRWPTNLVFVHGPSCQPAGTRRVRSGRSNLGVPHGTGQGTTYLKVKESGQHYAGEDGLETMAVWECQEGCPVAALDQQSGILHSHGGGSSHTLGFGDMRKEDGWSIPKGDSGGASRFFPQFADTQELEGWLTRLLNGP